MSRRATPNKFALKTNAEKLIFSAANVFSIKIVENPVDFIPVDTYRSVNEKYVIFKI